MNRNKIKEYLEMLDNTDIKYYKELEVALLIFLRSDLFTFNNYITDSDILKIVDLTNKYDSLLDIDKEELDNIISKDDVEDIFKDFKLED